MISSRFVAACALAAVAIVPLAGRAAPPSYNDAGMHFDAPAGWESLPVNDEDPTGSEDSQDPSLIGAFVLNKGTPDQNAITIKVARFDRDVDEFDVQHTSELRKAGDTFIAKNSKTTLSNGMPAYLVKATSGSQAGHYVETYEYLVCDRTRSIDVAYTGSEGSYQEKDALAALNSLYVVVYPKHPAH